MSQHFWLGLFWMLLYVQYAANMKLCLFLVFRSIGFKMTDFKFFQKESKNLLVEIFLKSFAVDFCNDVFVLIIIVDNISTFLYIYIYIYIYI